MRLLGFLIMFFSFLCGCAQSTNPVSPKHVRIGVSFKNGFKGDSLVLGCDGAVLVRSLAFSDSIDVPSGYLFTVNEGVHTLEIADLQLNIRSDTTFKAVSAYTTVIETSLDRKKRAFNNSISYLDTTRHPLGHPPTDSLQPVMPR